MHRGALALLLVGCASEELSFEQSPSTASAPLHCEESAVDVVELDEVAYGFDASPGEWLAQVEGGWTGPSPAGIVRTELAAGADQAEVVWSETEGCGPRYRVPVVQSFHTEAAGLVAVAEGTWESGDGAVSFETRCPLVDVVGLEPVDLVPAEWEEVDLELVTRSSGAGLALGVQWSATRVTEAVDSTATAGVPTSDAVSVSDAVELVLSADLHRDDR